MTQPLNEVQTIAQQIVEHLSKNYYAEQRSDRRIRVWHSKKVHDEWKEREQRWTTCPVYVQLTPRSVWSNDKHTVRSIEVRKCVKKEFGPAEPCPGCDNSGLCQVKHPGSPRALDNGCKCPVLDNAHGRGVPRYGVKVAHVVNAGCPLHGTSEWA